MGLGLDKPKLISDLKKIKELSTNGVDNTDAALEKLADAIEAYVKSGKAFGATSDGKTIIEGGLQ